MKLALSSFIIAAVGFISVEASVRPRTCEDRGIQAVWGQCGGNDYTGSTVCESDTNCVYVNDWYSQCQPVSLSSSSVSSTLAATSTVEVSSSVVSSSSIVVTSTPAATNIAVVSSTFTATSISTSVSPTPAPSSTSSASSASTSSISGYTPSSGIYPLYDTVSGIATSYGGNWAGGTCSFSDYPHDTGVSNGVALGLQQWFGAAGCGACVNITGPSGSVIAMVNDQCPECVDNHLDLDDSYGSQVDTNYQTDGIFNITWDFIPCPLSGNIQFKNKEGTSAYYFAMQVRNSVLPIDTLEVSTDGGSTWTNVERESYNFFTSYSGFGTTVDVRVTATTGAQIIQKGLTVSSGSIIEGSAQFSA